MNELRDQVKSLFEKGEIDLFIGYENGTRSPRPFFASSPNDADKLVFNNQCSGNLAVYLTKKELVDNKKIGVSASYYALKSIVQLLAEHQFDNRSITVFSLSPEEKLVSFGQLDQIPDFLKTLPIPQKQEDKDLIEQLNSMTSTERWEFWSDELSKCFKCYACRAACPMCYCTKCIVEVNRPQWIQPWATTLSNMEWQINRVMHMAGRCSDCGSCGAACPLGIPIHLLSHKITEIVHDNFGEASNDGNALSTFKPNDQEAFIL